MVATTGRGWKLAPSLVALVKEADRLWPNRDRTSDGSIGDLAHASRSSDHNPFEGWVHAVDLDEDIAPGTTLTGFVEHLRVSRDPRVRYVIYEGRIFKSYVSAAGPAWLWYRYDGPNAHEKHGHVSINRTAAARDDMRAWFPTATPPPPPPATPSRKARSMEIIVLTVNGKDTAFGFWKVGDRQVQVIKDAAQSRLYSLDWVGATQQTKDASITDYLELIERAIDHIGGPVNLIGDCQGGWLATIYAALRPDQVNTHTIAGAPIDFHADNPVIGDWLDAIDAEGDMAFYEWAVARGNGVLKGEFMLNGFVMIKPEQEVEKQMQLLSRLSDPQQLERYRVFEDWFKHTQDIPGAFYLWIVRHLFRGNELVGGTLAVGDEKVDLSRISCPLNLLAGGVDHITPPGQVFALAEAASTPKAKVTRRTTSGGHLGLFMGREALREHWPPLLAGVYEHSKPKASRARAEGRARAKTPAKRTKPAIPAP